MARHPESPVIRAGIVGAVFFFAAIAACAGIVAFTVKPAPAPAQAAKPEPIADMTFDELLANLGENAIGPIDCAKGIEAAGVKTQGQVLTGLIWQQPGRLVIVCVPS